MALLVDNGLTVLSLNLDLELRFPRVVSVHLSFSPFILMSVKVITHQILRWNCHFSFNEQGQWPIWLLFTDTKVCEMVWGQDLVLNVNKTEEMVFQAVPESLIRYSNTAWVLCAAKVWTGLTDTDCREDYRGKIAYVPTVYFEQATLRRSSLLQTN